MYYRIHGPMWIIVIYQWKLRIMDEKSYFCIDLLSNKCQVAQLDRALSWYAKTAGSIPGQDTYKNQPMTA